MDIPIISVADKLHKIRSKKGLTVSKFAEFLSIHPNTFRGFLSTNNPTVSSVYELSEKLKCSVAYLISLDELFSTDDMYYLGEGGKQLKPNVAARIDVILKEKDLRKYIISKRMGVSSSWWQPIMKRNNPSMKTLAKISYGLDVDPLELIKPISAEKYGTMMIPELPRGDDN